MTVKLRPLDLPARPAGRDPAPVLIGRPERALATALFFGMFAVYLFTLSAHFAPDGVAFARLVDGGQLARPGFFQAEHLLYPFVGWVWYQVWLFFGFELGSLAPLQVLNAVCGAGGVAAFFLAARIALLERRATLMPSLLAALVVGTSQGYWLHSTDAEDMIPAVAVTIVAFLLLLRVRASAAPSNRLLIGLGICLALAPLLHGTQFLFWPIAAFGLARSAGRRSIAIAGGVAVGLVLAAYLIVAVGVLGFRSPGEIVGWLTSAPRVGVWGRFDPRNLTTGARTAVGAFVSLGGGPRVAGLFGGSPAWTDLLAAATLVGFFGVVGVATVVLARAWRSLSDSFVVRVCLVWAALYGVFALLWAPADVQFWLTPVIPVVLLLTLAYLILQESPRTPHDLLAGLILFIFTALIGVNAVLALVPRSDIGQNLDYQRALCLADGLGERDLVISAGWDWAGTYLPYFTKLDYASLTDVHLGPGRRDPDATQALVAERIAAARARGGQVWTVHLFDLSSSDREWFERATGLSDADLAWLRGPREAECLGAPIRKVE